MPEGYNKPKWRLSPAFGLKAAAELGNLIKLRCRRCRQSAYYLPADLVEIYGDREVDDFKLPCSRCGTSETVQVYMHTPRPGDYGSLPIRRPRRVSVVKWTTVKLGEGIK